MKRARKEKKKEKKVRIISTVETTLEPSIFKATITPDGRFTSFKPASLGKEDPGKWLFCGL